MAFVMRNAKKGISRSFNILVAGIGNFSQRNINGLDILWEA